MDQTKTNVNNTSSNNQKESTPFSSGSTTPYNNSNSLQSENDDGMTGSKCICDQMYDLCKGLTFLAIR